MARTRFGCKNKKMKKSTKESVWQQLGTNILQKIFESVDPKDLFSSVSLVCRSWRLASWDLLFYKDHETLDLTTMRDLIHGGQVLYGYPSRLSNALKCVMNPLVFEDRLIRGIIIPRFVSLQNEDLSLISQRSPKLKRIVLPESRSINATSLEKAVQSWGDLEEISFGPIWDDGIEKVIEAMGKNCKNLSSLSISAFLNSLSGFRFVLEERISEIIVRNLQKLRVFSIKEAILYKKGVRRILDDCKELVEVDFHQCCRVINGNIDRFACISGRITKGGTGSSVCYIDSKEETNSSEEVVELLWSLHGVPSVVPADPWWVPRIMACQNKKRKL